MTAGANRDVRVRLSSSWEGTGIDLASREVTKFERDYRRTAQLQMSAANEMAAAEAAKAQAIVAANAKQRDAMASTGRAILGLAGASAAGLALATKAAIDWESAWAGVTKTVDGSPEQMAALKAELRGLASVLPATHQEIAAVAEAAGQLGIAAGDVAEFTKTAIDLGETTNLSADQAAIALAQFMNIMGTATGDVDRLGSAVVALGNNSATTERDIIEMSQRLAAAGRLVGATETDVLATAAALASMGVEAQVGGSSVSRILQRIYSDVLKGGDALKGYADVAGVTAEEFAQVWQDSPMQALAMFAEGLNDVEASGGNVIQTMADLGIRGTQEARVMLQLKANTDLLTDSLDMASDSWEANTALVDEASQRYATTEAKLQMARNQINDAAIDIGGNFLPVVADATEWVGQLAAGFSSLPPATQEFVTGLGAAATGIGLVVGGAAVVIPKLYELRKTLDALGKGNSAFARGLGSTATFLMGPWGIALAAAGVALAIFMQQQGEAKQRADAYRATLDELAQTTESTAKAFYEDLGSATTSWLSDDIRLRGTSMVDIMKNIGVSAQDAAGYIEGNAEATERVTAAMQDFQDAHPGELFSTASGQVSAFTDYLDKHREGVLSATEVQQLLIDTGVVSADVMNENASATDGATGATGEYGDAAGTAASAAEQLNQEIDDLIKGLRDLNSPTLDARAAARAWEAALDSVDDALEENGRTLDISSEKGRANQEVLDGMANNAIALAAAILEETGSEAEFRASLDESRQSLYETARRFGMSKEAAQEYVNSVLAVPPVVTTDVQINTDSASRSLWKFINDNTGRVIRLRVEAGVPTFNYGPSGGLQSSAQARGSVLEFYAGGGMRNLTPMAAVGQIVPPNTWRVVGDRGDVPESYIPHDGSDRSYAILGETMRRFGVAATPAAAPAAQGGSSGTKVDIHVGRLEQGTPQDVGAEVTWALQGAGLGS